MDQKQSGFQQFRPEDFRDDPTCFKINNQFGQLWDKVNSLYGSAQGAELRSEIKAPAFKATKQDQIPTDDTTLITLGTANKLFGPEVMREALATGNYVGRQVQPLLLGGDTFTFQVSMYAGFLTFAGGRLIKHT